MQRCGKAQYFQRTQGSLNTVFEARIGCDTKKNQIQIMKGLKFFTKDLDVYFLNS